MNQIRKDIETIADHYGPEHQLEKLKEELRELISAVSDIQLGFTQERADHLAEEIVDVEIMIAQIKVLIPTVEHLNYGWKLMKIGRQLNRIEFACLRHDGGCNAEEA